MFGEFLFTMKYKRGITLIEIIIVTALLGVVASLGLFVSTRDYQNSSFRNQRDMLVLALQHSRAQSMHNVCLGNCTDGAAHGVHLEISSGKLLKLIMFQGKIYNTTDSLNVPIDVGKNISQAIDATGPVDIYFEQLSADANPASIILSDETSASSTITIGSEGQISWTN
ncbi:MAG: type II secretion system protein [Patescibacteria group bacterium]